MAQQASAIRPASAAKNASARVMLCSKRAVTNLLSCSGSGAIAKGQEPPALVKAARDCPAGLGDPPGLGGEEGLGYRHTLLEARCNHLAKSFF